MKASSTLALCAALLVACSGKPPPAAPTVQVDKPPSQSAPEAATSGAVPAPAPVPETTGNPQPMQTVAGSAALPPSAYDSGGTGDAAAKKWDRQRKWMDQIKAGGTQRDQAMREINTLTSKDRSDFQRICKAYGIELK